jgi:hypothetical protein
MLGHTPATHGCKFADLADVAQAHGRFHYEDAECTAVGIPLRSLFRHQRGIFEKHGKDADKKAPMDTVHLNWISIS